MDRVYEKEREVVSFTSEIKAARMLRTGAMQVEGAGDAAGWRYLGGRTGRAGKRGGEISLMEAYSRQVKKRQTTS